jgi:hypothetical protein
MANLGMEKYDEVGAFMRKLCRDREKCNEMARNSDFATQEFARVLGSDLPKGHKIIAHLDEENVTHVIIPQKKDVEQAEASFTFDSATHRVWPPAYNIDPLATINERQHPLQAFEFLLGEYTLRRCKN